MLSNKVEINWGWMQKRGKACSKIIEKTSSTLNFLGVLCMCNERLIKSLFVLLKIFEKQHRINEENLKRYLEDIRNHLAENENIFLDFDFNSTKFYSKVLDEVLDYAIESRLIEVHPGSIFYSITDRGVSFINQIPNEFDERLQRDFKSNVAETVDELIPQQ